MRILALDTYDTHHEGDVYDAPDGQARKLIAKGLARAWDEPAKPGPKEDKSKPPHPNKAGEITEEQAAAMLASLPSSAAGVAPKSSASQAAPASAATTAAPSSAGARPESHLRQLDAPDRAVG
jgi:hypothetical protein